MCSFSFHLRVQLIMFASSQRVGIGGLRGILGWFGLVLGGCFALSFCLFLSLGCVFIKLCSCSPKTFWRRSRSIKKLLIKFKSVCSWWNLVVCFHLVQGQEVSSGISSLLLRILSPGSAQTQTIGYLGGGEISSKNFLQTWGLVGLKSVRRPTQNSEYLGGRTTLGVKTDYFKIDKLWVFSLIRKNTESCTFQHFTVNIQLSTWPLSEYAHELPSPSSITIYSKFGELSKMGERLHS